MSADTATGWWATQARESLGHAAQTAGREFPDLGEDRCCGRAEVLDELAGLVELVPDTVSAALDGPDATVTRLAGQLSAALTAQRNLQQRKSPSGGVADGD